MATYDLSVRFKGVDWEFDNNQSVSLACYGQGISGSTTNFNVGMYATNSQSVYEMEINYIAIDSSLNNYIYTCTGGAYIAIVAQVGSTLVANLTFNPSYGYMGWSGYSSQSKLILFCNYFLYNPALSTANHSFGLYMDITTVTTTSVTLSARIPFGLDNFTRIDSHIIYFNPTSLFTAKNIILNVEYFSTGDILTIKTLTSTSMYTYTYITGSGCDMTDNNTYLVLQPYFAANIRLNFQFLISGNNFQKPLKFEIGQDRSSLSQRLLFRRKRRQKLKRKRELHPNKTRWSKKGTPPQQYKMEKKGNSTPIRQDGAKRELHPNKTRWRKKGTPPQQDKMEEKSGEDANELPLKEKITQRMVALSMQRWSSSKIAQQKGLKLFKVADLLYSFIHSISGNSVFAAAQNYYALKFTLVNFCALICDTLTYPFLYRVNNQCYDICPSGYYGNTTTTYCELCQLNCSTCSMAQTNCTSCINGTFLYNFTCEISCPSTMYGDIFLKQCLNCTGNCLDCQTDATNCTSCITNFYLFIFDCVSECPPGFYGNTTTTFCELCQLNCSTCQITQTNCTSCVNGSFLLYNLCGVSCPSTMYGDTLVNQCLNCTGNCLDCQNYSTNCTSCLVDFFLYSFDCLSECPLGYYGNNATGACEICQANCLNCSSLTQCFACSNGTFLFNFDCLLSCPNTTYENVLVNECLPCEGTCFQCDILPTNCTSCINNTFYLGFDCYYNCPVGYCEDISTGNCQPCFLNCSTCTAVNVCTQCILNHFLAPNFDKCETSCPPNYFPNSTTRACQRIIIQGCISALYFNGVPICLQCDVSQYFKYVPSNKSCVCKDGYKLNNGTCQEYCGDGIVNNMPCDDGNFVNGDGCSFQCLVENNFNCSSVLNGPTLKSKCLYLPEINIQILSETKLNGQNTLKLILKVFPTPLSLTSDQIKQFLNLKIDSDVINMSKLQINYKNGIAQIYIPFTKDIQDKKLSLWTNLDPNLFSSSNIFIFSILKGDNVALLYSSDLTLYKVIGTFNFSMAIFVCIFALLVSYKHKMIGLELIMPFQVILYSQSFYNLKTLQATFYTSFKPVSYSILTPDQNTSKNNAWYKIGMTGGFLENYNLLGLIFLISTILLIINMFKLQHGQRNRFKHKKALRDWLNFGQFKILIRQYQPIIWKYFFISFCLSTIPLIFSVSAKAMTVLPNFYTQTIFDIINDKCNYLFFLLFMGALFYTSIPRIFYNNKKNLLKKHIFKREGEKFKYDASYCTYFQLHYLFIGFIYAYCPPTLPVFYTISGINGLFFIYLVVKRPYESILDNVGALLSGSIVVYFLSINIYIKIAGNQSMIKFLSKISGFLITFLLFVQCVVAIVRLIIFWAHDKEQNLNGLTRDQKMDKFQYQKDKAFNKFVRKTKDQEVQISNMMNRIQGEMIFNQPKTINKQLIPKLFQADPNQNPRNSIIDYTQPKIQSVSQQKYSSLKRLKNNLKQSLKIYKLSKQQSSNQTKLYYQN